MEAFVRHAAIAAPPSPRLIITDYYMPGMETADVMAAIRTVPAYQRIPVLLFSSLAEEEGQRRLAHCGAVAFVHKPGDLEEFVTAVATMVHRWGATGGASDSAPARDEKQAAGSDA